MNKLLVINFLFTTFIGNMLNGQQVLDVKYYNDYRHNEIVVENKAKYVERIYMDSNDIVHHEVKKIKNNKTIYVVEYPDSIYANIPRFDITKKSLIDSIKGTFESPFFKEEKNSFRNYIQKRLEYPEDAVKKKIDGRVLTQFVIDENGKITNLIVKKSVYKSLDDEVVRVILDSPEWVPARLNDKPIKVLVEVPFIFLLQ